MGNFFLVPVNYLAVVICAVLAMVIGFLWYGPVFGKTWEKMVGLTADKKDRAKKDMPKTFEVMFLASLVMAYTMAHFVWYAAPGSLTMFISIKTAIWAWLGFVATTTLSRFMFSPDKKPVTLFLIDSGYYLVTLIVMGIVLAVFV